jgi:hypothetical protein
MATADPMLTMPSADTAAPRAGRSPLGNLLLAVGGILVAGLIVSGGVTLLDVAAQHTYDVRASYPAVRSVSIAVDGRGDVQLTSAPAGSRVAVTTHLTEALTAPHRTAAVEPGGQLQLTGRCGGFDLECRVGYTVAVPLGIPVDVRAGAGDVTASGLHAAGPIRLNSGGGDIRASDISSPNVVLTSGAGNIVGARIDSPWVSLSSGSGDIAMDVTSPVDKLVAAADAGAVTLRVPSAVYSLHASSGSGSISDDLIRTDPASPRSIDAASGAGDIRITPDG